MARINGIQAALENYSFRRLIQLEARLRSELEMVMAQEEILWLQKSRKDWLLHGDKNTNFFHKKKLLLEGGEIELRPSRIIRGIGCTMRKKYATIQLGIFLPYLKAKLKFIKFIMYQIIFQSWMLMILIVLLTWFWRRKLKSCF